MKKTFGVLVLFFLFIACHKADIVEPIVEENPELSLAVPADFPEMNTSVAQNKPTKFGVALGEKLFNEKRFSVANTISCGSCHQKENAFADHHPKGVGVYDRVGLRNAPPVQNMAFMKFYNWDGNVLQLEKQPLVPIITHEEMNSSIVEVISKISAGGEYQKLFKKAFGDINITPDRIYRSIAQYEYTLISANSKYDKVKRNEGEVFTETEKRGYQAFLNKCATCHSTGLFTDQSFRNVGFPLNPSTEEAGRSRVTGIPSDYRSFRVPSLRNAEFTAPYGSFGQFAALIDVLNYFDNGVLDADNLDPILKANGNRIPLTETEKHDIISFIKTLSDEDFVGR
ncbi:cytochrome-c peroxidase [Pedobacter arcticus]|uniref:cytochrome-c peroxidase n=1 Tax=Pedobacter arcticus TaxID=752140 RepID=UPI0002EAFD1A|nr:cytochrome c peroxidase [Pedobacter arcticus]